MHENGFAEIDEMYLEYHVTRQGRFAICNKQVDHSAKLDLNIAAHWGGIVIMGNKEECQIPRINATILEVLDKIL